TSPTGWVRRSLTDRSTARVCESEDAGNDPPIHRDVAQDRWRTIPPSPIEREEFEVKRRPLAAAGVAIVALALGVALLSVHGSGGRQTEQGAVNRKSEGLASEGLDRVEADRGVQDRRAATVRAATASFGPNVIQGRFDGESPAVISLPVI